MNLVHSFLTAVLTFLGTLVGQTVVEVYRSDNGWYSISTAVIASQAKMQILDIYNYSSTVINGLYVVVPAYESTTSVISSGPVLIEHADSAHNQQNEAVLSVSLLPARQATKLFIPWNEDSSVRVLNGDEKGLFEQDSLKLPSPLRSRILSIVVSSLIFGTLIGLSMYWLDLTHDKRVRWAMEELEGVRKNNTTVREQLASTEKEIHEIKMRSAKANLLMLSRLRDYAKELDFWRDTIRTLFKHGQEGKIDIFFDDVTRKLKTFGVLKNNQVLSISKCWLD